MAEQKSQAVTLTAEQLQEIMINMAKEIRKPADPTPEQLAEKAQNEQMRADRGKMELDRIANRRLNQSLCDHSREDQTSNVVPIYNNQGGIGFLICQSCQAIIRAGERPTGAAGKDTENDIYDTNLFNRELRRSMKRPAMG